MDWTVEGLGPFDIGCVIVWVGNNDCGETAFGVYLREGEGERGLG